MSDYQDPFREASSALHVKQTADNIRSATEEKAKKENEEIRDRKTMIQHNETASELLAKLNKLTESNNRLTVSMNKSSSIALGIAIGSFVVAVISLAVSLIK